MLLYHVNSQANTRHGIYQSICYTSNGKMNSKTPTKLSYIIEVPKVKDEGYLCFIEEENHIPFPIKRVYYIFDVIKNAVRGKHTHKKTKQVIFCIHGSITIILDDGHDKEAITLSKPHMGVYLDTMMWHEMVAFKKGTVLLVLASEKYDAKDYIRSFEEFLKKTKKGKKEK